MHGFFQTYVASSSTSMDQIWTATDSPRNSACTIIRLAKCPAIRRGPCFSGIATIMSRRLGLLLTSSPLATSTMVSTIDYSTNLGAVFWIRVVTSLNLKTPERNVTLSNGRTTRPAFFIFLNSSTNARGRKLQICNLRPLEMCTPSYYFSNFFRRR